jgi:uncharacterized protein (TIGR02246 family)
VKICASNANWYIECRRRTASPHAAVRVLIMVHCSGTRACFWIAAWIVLACVHDSFAQSPANRAKDEAAVRQAGKDYLAAIERGDNKAVAEFWTTDGTYVDEAGHTVKVSSQLAKAGDQFGNSTARSKSDNTKLRFLTDDVVIESGEFTSPGVDCAAPGKGRYTARWVREGSRWKLDNLQEMQSESTSDADQLAALNIFAGEWAGQLNNIDIHVSATWDANKKFMRRETKMVSGKAELSGTQQIGWDPLTQQIRSWMFSDDGSYSEGVWSLQGNTWMAPAMRVLPDGTISQATQVYKFPDKNTLVWKVIRGSIDGRPTDDFEIVLKRSGAK